MNRKKIEFIFEYKEYKTIKWKKNSSLITTAIKV